MIDFSWLFDKQTLQNLWLAPIIIIGSFVVVMIIIRYVVLRWLGKLAERTETAIDDIFVKALSQLSWYILIIGVIALAIDSIHVLYPARVYLKRFVLSSLSVVLTVFLSRVLSAIIKAGASASHGTVAATSLVRKIVSIAVYVTGAIMVLNIFGLSITPVITALGIGGIAVALALQDTLGNIFSGIAITLSNHYRVGDSISVREARFRDPIEGVVVDIGWRNTLVKLFDETVVSVPNIAFAQSTVTNFSQPNRFLRMRIPINLGYDAPTEKVEEILKTIIVECTHDSLEAALAEEQIFPKIRFALGAEVEGVSAPNVLITNLNENSVTFLVLLTIADADMQGTVRHILLKRILDEFRRHGISAQLPPRELRILGGA